MTSMIGFLFLHRSWYPETLCTSPDREFLIDTFGESIWWLPTFLTRLWQLPPRTISDEGAINFLRISVRRICKDWQMFEMPRGSLSKRTRNEFDGETLTSGKSKRVKRSKTLSDDNHDSDDKPIYKPPTRSRAGRVSKTPDRFGQNNARNVN